MPKLTGLFSGFDNLDQISAEAVASWLKPVPQLLILENYIANRILYPQALPQSETNMQIDLAILREALRINGPRSLPRLSNVLLGSNPFLNITLRKILIPREFVDFVPSLVNLIHAFVDAFLLDREKKDWFDDLWTIVLSGDTDEIVGSVLLPQFNSKSGILNLKLLGKDYGIRQGSLMVIPCPKERCEIAYKVQGGRVLDKTENAVEISGGKAGLVIDGRGI